MKYVITENKLYGAIYNYIDSKFSREEINWTYGTDYDPYTDEIEHNENFLIFYKGGTWAGEDYSDIVFYYYSKEYYENEPNSEVWTDDAPILSVNDKYYWELQDMFGNYWKEPMKEWFENKFHLPVTTVTDDQ
jgi:hypothetical protein